MARFLWLGLVGGLLVVSVGCRNVCNRHPWCARKDTPAQPVYVAPPAPAPIYSSPPSGVVPSAFPTMPPNALTTPPPGANILQPAQPAQPAPSISKSPPVDPAPRRNDTQWQPGDGREPPRETSPRDVPPRVQLYAPEPLERDPLKERPNLGPPEIEKENRLPEDSPAKKKPGVPIGFPAIPQFAVAQENVFAGLRPPLDGLDWLQARGVKTVLHVRLAGEDDSTDRKEVEARGMRYIALEVSPQTLTREKADEFIREIRAGARTGIFVYDKDGSLAGAMWYLYQRMGESNNDDVAQLNARPLGLQTARDGQHRDMWQAAQRVANENR